MVEQGDWRFQVVVSGSWKTLPLISFEHTRYWNSVHEAVVVLPFYDDDDAKVISFLSGNQEARLQRYTGSVWETWHAGTTENGGRIKTVDSTVEVLVRGVGYQPANTFVEPTFGADQTNLQLMNTLWSGVSGFSVATPTGATTYTISDYHFSGDRKSAVAELSSNYRWTTYIDHDNSDYAPGAGSHTVRYEPTGFGDSEITLDTESETDGVFVEEWERDRYTNNFGTVQVIGTADDGTKVSASAGSGSPFKRIQVSYVKTNAEAQDIADQIAGTGVGDGGRVTTSPWFVSSVVNELITLVDPIRNINDSFVVKTQINRFPEMTTTFQLGFSEYDDGVGEISDRERELREERSQLFLDSEEEVGEQTVTGNVDAHKHNPFDIGHGHNIPNITSTTSEIRADYDWNENSGLLKFPNTVFCDVFVQSPGGSPNSMLGNVLITGTFGRRKDTLTSDAGYTLQIRNTYASITYIQENTMGVGVNATFAILLDADNDDVLVGDRIRVSLIAASSLMNFDEVVSVSASVQSFRKHTHDTGNEPTGFDDANVLDNNRSPAFSGSSPSKTIQLSKKSLVCRGDD